MNRISIRGVTAALVAAGVVATGAAVAVPAIAAVSADEPATKRQAVPAWDAGRAAALDWQLTNAAPPAKPKPKVRPVAKRASRSTFRQSLSGSPREIAHAMLLNRGWSETQWGCLDSLWQRESGWSIYSSNASSGAYGIPQALPGSKMAEFGSDWQTNPVTQITWGLSYISQRYGTPCAAWDHSNAYGFY